MLYKYGYTSVKVDFVKTLGARGVVAPSPRVKGGAGVRLPWDGSVACASLHAIAVPADQLGGSGKSLPTRFTPYLPH